MDNFIEIPASKSSLVARKKVCGIATNDADYIVFYVNDEGVRITCHFYKTWAKMIDRCYGEVYQKSKPTYKSCSVCSEWLYFSNFKQWMKRQDYKGKALDKDILIPGNKIYSEESCVFVDLSVNCLLINVGACRGEYPQGVSLQKGIRHFIARCSVDGKQRRLGSFDSPIEASKVYINYKCMNILRVAESQSDLIRDGLIKHAELMLDGIGCR